MKCFKKVDSIWRMRGIICYLNGSFIFLSLTSLLFGCILYETSTGQTSRHDERYELGDGRTVNVVRDSAKGSKRNLWIFHEKIDSVQAYYVLTDRDNFSVTIPEGVDGKRLFRNLMKTNENKMACIQMLMAAGEFLLVNPLPEGSRLESESEERKRGWNIISYGYVLLLEDLKGHAIRRDSFVHRIKLHEETVQYTRTITAEWQSEVMLSAMDYYFFIWENLPGTPTTFSDFLSKHAVCEHIKYLLMETPMMDMVRWQREDSDFDQLKFINKSFCKRILAFLEQAFSWHQLPSISNPDPHGARELLGTTQVGFRRRENVYVMYPKKKQLGPRKALAETDLVLANKVLDFMVRQNMIKQEEYEIRRGHLSRLGQALNIDYLKFQLERLQRAKDKIAIFDIMIELSVALKDVNDVESAERLVQSAYEGCKEIGHKRKWASTLLDLITDKTHKNNWNEALELHNQLNNVHYEMYMRDRWDEALYYEYMIKKKLGMEDEAESARETYKQWVSRYESAERMISQIEEEYDPIAKKELVLLLLEREEIPRWFRFGLRVSLINLHQQLEELDEAEKLATEIIPEAIHWKGQLGHAEVLDALLQIYLKKGDFAGFLEAFNEFENVNKQLRGSNWALGNGKQLAQGFLRLQNYRRAEQILLSYMDAKREILFLMETGDIKQLDEDALFLARIRLGLGKEYDVRKTIEDFEERTRILDSPTGVVDVGVLRSKIDIIFQLAEIKVAAGQKKGALELLNRILPKVDPKKNFDLWVEVMILKGDLHLRLGESPDDLAAKFEAMIPGLHEYPDMLSINVVKMDVFLSDYYRFKQQSDKAKKRLLRALQLSKDLGFVDEQITIYRKLGELAYGSHDLKGASEYYSKAIEILNSISRNIFSDVSKVGYRSERNTVVPLYFRTLSGLYEKNQEELYLEEMFRVIEMDKSRALSEMLFGHKERELLENFSLSSIRGVLGSQTAILGYYIPQGAENRMYRYYVSDLHFELDVLDAVADETEKRIGKVLSLVKATHRFDEEELKAELKTISQLLLPQSLYSDSDTRVKRLYVIPTGTLHFFPFHLLMDHNGKYLDENEDLEVAYLPNASILMRRPPVLSNTTRSMAFVSPSLDPEHHKVLSESTEIRQQLENSLRKWSNCPLAWEEKLTKHEFLSKIGNVDNVFIYSHVTFTPDDPMGSYIKMARDNAGDYQLSAIDLLTCKTGNGLWTLAGCSSGRGEIRSGDEVLGLPRAILQAGATMVVISLWDIGAESSLQMMADFYNNMANGLSAADALRMARTKMRKSGKMPYYWAPFILVGSHGYKKQ